MASIVREFMTTASPSTVWDAARDAGALHTRLVPGFVVDTKLEPGARIVTFANGMTAKELIVGIDDQRRRIAWSAVGGRLTHHNASLTVLANGDGSRLVWEADLLPNELAPVIAQMIDQGCVAMKVALDKLSA
ncbi:MAG: SRPBCC family protein [Micropepsaceae bacterium]